MFITNMLSVAKLQKNEEKAKGKGLFLFISECQQLQQSQNFKNIIGEPIISFNIGISFLF